MKMEFSLLVWAGNLLVISDAWLSARKRPLAGCTAGKSPLAPSCRPWCGMWSMLYVHNLKIMLLSLSCRWLGKHVKMNYATWSLWYLIPKISKRQNKNENCNQSPICLVYMGLERKHQMNDQTFLSFWTCRENHLEAWNFPIIGFC